MKKRLVLKVIPTVFLTLIIVAGISLAAVFPEDNTFTGTVNQFEKGIKIGKQGTGGVTFFNGTIVNQTTTDGTDNPVTFGDNVRIDGRIHRGNQAGPAGAVADTKPVQINDDLEVYGGTTIKGKAKFEGGVEGIPSLDVYTKTESDGRYVREETVKGYYSVAPSDIVPQNPKTYTFVRASNYLYPSDLSSSNYSAGIHLPHGAVVKKLTLRYIDNSANKITAVLDRTGSPPAEMAKIETTGQSLTSRTQSDETIQGATINNASDFYSLLLLMPDGSNTQFYGAYIEYEISK